MFCVVVDFLQLYLHNTHNTMEISQRIFTSTHFENTILYLNKEVDCTNKRIIIINKLLLVLLVEILNKLIEPIKE